MREIVEGIAISHIILFSNLDDALSMRNEKAIYKLGAFVNICPQTQKCDSLESAFGVGHP